MPLVLESTDALPYIDGPITDETRNSVSAIVNTELPPEHASTLHPRIPENYTPEFSHGMDELHERIASGEKKMDALNLGRYEELDPPEETSPSSGEDQVELLRKWNDTLRQAYSSSEYLSTRLTTLGVLEQYGKNSWLIGNSQLEDVLKGIEAELAETRLQHEQVEAQRRAQQESARGEMASLEEGWRKGVGRMIETEVAAEGIRREVLEKQRAMAS